MAETSRIDELRRRLHADPTSVVFAALAEEYRRSGRLDEAVQTCRVGLVRHPSYASAHVTLGRALADQGHAEEACSHFERALRIAPDNLVAARSLAEVLRRMGKLPEALARFRQALSFAPGDPELLADVTSLQAQLGSPAVSRLERFLEAIQRRRAELQTPGHAPSGGQ